MNTVHINIEDKSGRVYCHRIPALVKPRPDHFIKHCSKCRYFVDTAVGKGVSCFYDDGSNTDTVVFYDAVESERYNKDQMVKQGLITQEEANATMHGYDDEQVKVMGEDVVVPEEPERNETEEIDG